MFICICNAVREADFRKAAIDHDGDAEAVYAAMGHDWQCGQCLTRAQAVVDEERTLAGSMMEDRVFSD